MAGIDSYTKLMLHCDGIDGSTTFTDSSSNNYVPTVVGNSQIDTAQSKFGGASGLFDGTLDTLSYNDSADWDLTGDFTIDFWFRVSALSRLNTFIARPDMLGSNSVELMMRIDSSNQFDCFIRTGSGAGTIIGRITVASGVSINTWYHLAYVRNGSAFALYLNGTSVGTASSASTGSDTSYKLNVGGREDSSSQSLQGWMDEVRISKGIARWTTNFTPPTEAYSGDSTSLQGKLTTIKGIW